MRKFGTIRQKVDMGYIRQSVEVDPERHSPGIN
jgi:hypothetical protein